MCFLNRFLLMALVALEIAAWTPGLIFLDYFNIRLFAGFIGLINAAIHPLLLLFLTRITVLQVACAAFIANILFFIIAHYFLGIYSTSIIGAVSSFLILWAASTIANRWIYLETTQL